MLSRIAVCNQSRRNKSVVNGFYVNRREVCTLYVKETACVGSLNTIEVKCSARRWHRQDRQ